MAKLFFPPSIDWELTDICNHKCIHCYNYWRQTCDVSLYRDEAGYLEIAEKLVMEKPVSVQITGGEPLLVWDRVKKGIDLLIESGVVVSINTNATCVSEEIAEYLGKNEMDAFISFPCVKPEVFDEIVNCKGAYEKAVKGIHLLHKHHVRTSLNMVVTKRNFPFVYDTAKFVHKEFGEQYFSVTKASFPAGAVVDFREQMLSREEFNVMLSELMRAKRDFGLRVDSAWVYSLCGFDDEVREQFGFNRKCTCGKYSFVVDALGNIRACGCDPVSYGNVLKDRFAEAIAKMVKWQDGSMIPARCRNCKWLLYCGSGCRSDALSNSGEERNFDSTACVEKSENELVRIRPSVNIDKNELYVLNPKACVIEENGFKRISFKTNYDFVSYGFAEVLMSGNAFSADALSRVSGRSMEITSIVISQLFGKGLLVKTDERKDIQINKEGFELLVSPFEEPEYQQWQNDYAGFRYSCKQFM